MHDIATLKVRKSALHVEVAEFLRELIIGGELKPGEQLREVDLLRLFDVSRTPLREAFKVLEVEGLIEIRPNKGAFVSSMSASQTVELFELIANIERIAVELAVERMGQATLRKLVQMHEDMMKYYRAGKRRECFELDFDTHNLIVATTGNSLLVATHETLMARARRGRYGALFSQPRWDEAMEEHDAIMGAIKDGNAQEAGQLMRAHVLATGDVICRRLEAELAENATGQIHPALRRPEPVT